LELLPLLRWILRLEHQCPCGLSEGG
jgi:hypothetical protein